MSIMTRKTAGLLTAFAVMSFAAAPMFAQQPAVEKVMAAPPRPAVAAEESEAEAPKKPGVEGVKIHGHWTIDLKDKDGNVIDHRDFENALIPIYGSQLLVELLIGGWTPGNLFMEVGHAPTFPSNGITGYQWQMYPAAPNPTATACPADAQYSPAVSLTCVPSLTVQASPSPNGNNAIVLRGAFSPGLDVSIDTVESGIGVCIPVHYLLPNPVASGACTAGTVSTSDAYPNSAPFTRTTLANPIAVANGQQLVVTVTLSFS